MSKVEIGLTNIFLQQKDKKYDTLPSSVKDIGYLFRLDDIQPSKNDSHDDDDDDDDDDDENDLDPGTGGRMAVAHFSPPNALPPSLRQSWEKSSNPETDFFPPKNVPNIKL